MQVTSPLNNWQLLPLLQTHFHVNWCRMRIYIKQLIGPNANTCHNCSQSDEFVWLMERESSLDMCMGGVLLLGSYCAMWFYWKPDLSITYPIPMQLNWLGIVWFSGTSYGAIIPYWISYADYNFKGAMSPSLQEKVNT